jgi:stress response protein SCP2
LGEYEDKVKGEFKDTGGKLTGDKSMEFEGKTDKAKGKVEEAGRKLTGEGDEELETRDVDKGDL